MYIFNIKCNNMFFLIISIFFLFQRHFGRVTNALWIQLPSNKPLYKCMVLLVSYWLVGIFCWSQWFYVLHCYKLYWLCIIWIMFSFVWLWLIFMKLWFLVYICIISLKYTYRFYNLFVFILLSALSIIINN